MKKIMVGALLCSFFLATSMLTACGDPGAIAPPAECEHSWQETSRVDATCTKVGTVDWECSVCGDTKQTTLDKIAHSPKTEYGGDDKYHWQVCKTCDDVMESTRQPHSGGKATYDQKAVCEICGKPYGELLSTDIKMNEFFNPANGGFRQYTASSVISTANNSLMIKRDAEFKLGTLSATVALSGTASDNGIVFGMTNPTGMTQYWEQGVSYYFFFVSRDGFAYLGKVTDGSWSALATATIPGFNHSGTYELKVERDETSIKCYVDGTLYVNYSEPLALQGTGYGLRAGAIGVAFSELYCDSYGELPTLTEGNLRTVRGGTAGSATLAVTTQNDTLAYLEQKGTSGTFALNVITGGGANAGLVFGMTEDGKEYYSINANNSAHRFEVYSRKAGRTEKLYSNYISAGISGGSNCKLKVVLDGGKAYTYFNDILYAVLDVTLPGDNFGIYSDKAGAQFFDYAYSESAATETVDTLLFGHSYFELWSNWKADLKNVPNIGTYTNIGVGGSIAAHWTRMRDAILAYRPSTVIYMIGINDITGGVSPASVAGDVEWLLDELKTELPELKAVVLSVNYCPAREQFRTQIRDTNELFKSLCARNDWMNYAEMLTAFCDIGDTPAARWFTDGLHPSADGYTQRIVPAIVSALNGENQPALGEDDAAKALAAAKARKLDLLLGYDPDAYSPANRHTAQNVYERAATEINACATVNEVNALDLSEYISELDSLESRSDEFFAAMSTGENCEKNEAVNFTAVINNSKNNKLMLYDFGHRLYKNIDASDLSFTFRMSDLTGECGIGGVLFRASRDGGNGVNGYLINYVTDADYIQIWYLAGAYGGSRNYLEYIGGWVFPDEVEDTLFRAIVENDHIYIYTEADYRRLGKNGYGCSVALDGSNMGHNLPVYRSGMLGVVNWQNASVTYKLEIGLLSYKQIGETPSERRAEQNTTDVDTYIEKRDR